jgi:hypothetical protein
MTTKLPAFVLAALLLVPATAAADATFFYGRQTSDNDKSSTRGFALGVSMAIVGFEFEYANVKGDETLLRPSLKTTSGNVLLQTIGIPNQFYFTTGGGYYQEELGKRRGESLPVEHWGRCEATHQGPLRVRVDYRIFSLKGSPRDKTQHRSLCRGQSVRSETD